MRHQSLTRGVLPAIGLMVLLLFLARGVRQEAPLLTMGFMTLFGFMAGGGLIVLISPEGKPPFGAPYTWAKITVFCGSLAVSYLLAQWMTGGLS